MSHCCNNFFPHFLLPCLHELCGQYLERQGFPERMFICPICKIVIQPNEVWRFLRPGELYELAENLTSRNRTRMSHRCEDFSPLCLLPCRHEFCGQCLEGQGYPEKSFICPTCRRNTQPFEVREFVRPGELDKLTENITVKTENQVKKEVEEMWEKIKVDPKTTPEKAKSAYEELTNYLKKVLRQIRELANSVLRTATRSLITFKKAFQKWCELLKAALQPESIAIAAVLGAILGYSINGTILFALSTSVIAVATTVVVAAGYHYLTSHQRV